MTATRTPAFLLLAYALLFTLPARADSDLSGQRIYRLMCVGDTVDFADVQYPLWEKLFSAGYLIEFTGSRTNSSRIGALKNECYSGKTAEQISTNAIEAFRKAPADVVLVQAAAFPRSGENPTTNVLAAYNDMIRSFREANPDVAVLIAPMPPAANLPQYAYVHDLKVQLAKLAKNLSTPKQPVTLIKIQGFDAADSWFEALKKILEPPKQSYHPKIVTYKNASGTNLTLHIFEPPHKFHGPHPAIVFFFGGGWVRGTPIQFYQECAHFAEEGFVAISADYRVESVEHTTPFESVSDGKSAIRWVRAHARQLHIDPDRIVGAGASAGGHVAAAAATVKGLDDPHDDLAISPRPNALVLWYAVIDNGPGGYGYNRIKDRYPEISPLHNVDSHTPPTLFFLGTKDSLIAVGTAANFKARIDKAGGRCELKLFENAPHGFGDYRKGDNQLRRECIAAADDFLSSLNLILAQP